MIFLLVIFFILGSLGAWFIARYGSALGYTDTPNIRSSHTVPTPKGGGIGIILSFLVAAVLTRQSLGFVVPVIIIAGIALYDDRHNISARLRLLVQCIGACSITLSIPDHILSPFYIPFLFFSIVFLVGSANFYNFMDGINGIAGLTGCLAFGFMAVYLPANTEYSGLRVVAAALSLSCAGFLPFNVPTAKVFMGDVGSIPLGLIFAAMVITLSATLLDFICYAALLTPFYLDELSTMALRIRKRENLLTAHRTHLYQLLANECGMDHWKVTSLYGLMQIFLSFGVFFLKDQGIGIVLIFLFICAIVFVGGSLLVRRRVETMKQI